MASFWSNLFKRSAQNSPGVTGQFSASKKQLTISWVIPGKLAVGRLPRPGDGAQLARANIKVVLSLCPVSEGTLPPDVTENFQCLSCVLPDSHYDMAMNVSDLAWAVELVHQTVQNQLPIYVHCFAGIERSPTICIAYLCRYRQLEIWEAVSWLKQVRPICSPTEHQLRTVRDFLLQETEKP